MKTKVISVFSTVAICLGIIFSNFNLLHLSVFALEDDFCNNQDCVCYNNRGENISFESSKIHFSPFEQINVTYKINSHEQIQNINYESNGLTGTTVSTFPIDRNKLIIITDIDKSVSAHSLDLEITLTSGKLIRTTLYVFSNEYGSFISPLSWEEAREVYFEYAISNKILTEKECMDIRMNFWRTEITESYSYSNVSTYSTAITINGTLEWITDNDYILPIIGVKVELYHSTNSGDILLDTTYADEEGTFTFIRNDISDKNIFFKIYTSDDNVIVKRSNYTTPHYYESYPSENTISGNIINYYFITSTTFTLGQAFEVSQAVLYAKNYARTMINDPNVDFLNVHVFYPYNTTSDFYYDDSSLLTTDHAIIALGGTVQTNYPKLHESWDAIMHEYGHHVQNILGMNRVTSYAHNSNECDSKQYGKSVGHKLAWSESWPTIFALMAQEYYDFGDAIITADDAKYTAYNGIDDEIEYSDIALGDACECSIMAVLWDLYDDTPTEANDSIALGHQTIWDLSTNPTVMTFSDFMQSFYSAYPNYIDAVAPMLAYYGIAANAPVVATGDLTYDETPVFQWLIYNYSERFQFNTHVIIFYDVNDREIIREQTTTFTYFMSRYAWNRVLNAEGDTFSVRVLCSSSITPATGPYYSPKNTFTKPM